MKRFAGVEIAACAVTGLFALLTVAGCAKTISGCSATAAENGKYFNADSKNDQQAYFVKVKGHFQQIGRPLGDDEVKQYTASIFIATIPPGADVYDDTNYVGKANNGQLYFTPGKHRVVLKKDGQQKSNVIDLTEGKNLSVVVKL